MHATSRGCGSAAGSASVPSVDYVAWLCGSLACGPCKHPSCTACMRLGRAERFAIVWLLLSTFSCQLAGTCGGRTARWTARG